jgi:hypothetical protein
MVGSMWPAASCNQTVIRLRAGGSGHCSQCRKIAGEGPVPTASFGFEHIDEILGIIVP